jgi:hypothetical protein
LTINQGTANFKQLVHNPRMARPAYAPQVRATMSAEWSGQVAQRRFITAA